MPTINVKWFDNTSDLKASLRSGVDVIEATRASVTKLVQALSGESLFATAHKWTAAIDQMGGVEKLTNAERERTNALLEKAIEKYTALGQTAPQAIRDLAEATKTVAPPTAQLTGIFDQLKGAIENPTEALKGFATTALEGVGEVGLVIGGAITVVGALAAGMVELAGQARDVAASVQRVSEVTGMSVAGVSALKFAIEAAGGSLEQTNNLMFMFSERMDNSGATVEKGLKQIGLSLDQIKDMGADQRLFAISDALRASGDDANKAAAAYDIFGRQGRDALPLLLKPLRELADTAHDVGAVLTDQAAKGAEEFELRLNTLKAESTAARTELGLQVSVWDELTYAWERTKLAGLNVALTAGDLATTYRDLTDAQAGYIASVVGDLPTVKTSEGYLKNVAAAVKGLGLEAKDGNNLGLHPLSLSVAALATAGREEEEAAKASIETHKKAAAEAAQLATALDKVERSGYADSVAMQIMAGDLTKVGTKTDDVERLKKGFDDLAASIKRSADSVHEIPLAWPSDVAAMSKNLGGDVIPVTRQTVPAMGTLPAGSAGIGKQSGNAFETGFETGIANLPTSILHAIQGGGSVSATIGSTMGESIGTSIEGSLDKSIGKSLGSGLVGTLAKSLTGMIPVVGALVGPLLDKLFGGPSKQELEGRKVEDTFQQQFGSFDKMMAAVGTAYAATGKSAAEAQADVQALMAAEKQGGDAATAAAAKIQATIDAHKAVVDAIHAEGFQSSDDLQAAADLAGKAFEEMRASGEFSAADLTAAYLKFQQALAATGDKAAAAWVAAHGAVDATTQAMNDAASAGYKNQAQLTKAAAEAENLAEWMAQQTGPNAFSAADIADAFNKANKAITDAGFSSNDEMRKAAADLQRQQDEAAAAAAGSTSTATTGTTTDVNDMGIAVSKIVTDTAKTTQDQFHDALSNVRGYFDTLGPSAQSAAAAIAAALGGMAFSIPVSFAPGAGPTIPHAATGGMVTDYGIRGFDAGGYVLGASPAVICDLGEPIG